MNHTVRNRIVGSGIGIAFALYLLNCLPADAGYRENGPVTLRYKFKAGDVSNYQTNGQFQLQPPNMQGHNAGNGPSKAPGAGGNSIALPLNASQTVKVLKALADGSGQLEVTVLSGGTGTSGGAPTPKTVSYTLSPTGAISNVKASSGKVSNDVMSALSGSIMSGSITVPLPEKAVKPGDTWKLKMPIAQAGSNGTVTGTFTKIGQIGRYKTAHIKQVISVPIRSVQQVGTGNGSPNAVAAPTTLTISGNVSMTFEYDFAMTEGKLIKSSGKGTVDVKVLMSPAPGKNGHVSTPPLVPIAGTINLSSTLVQ